MCCLQANDPIHRPWRASCKARLGHIGIVFQAFMAVQPSRVCSQLAFSWYQTSLWPSSSRIRCCRPCSKLSRAARHSAACLCLKCISIQTACRTPESALSASCSICCPYLEVLIHAEFPTFCEISNACVHARQYLCELAFQHGH